MVKVKRLRTADCVVVGWRPGKEEGTVGSLILGLYKGKDLRVVGHTSGLQREAKARAGRRARALRDRRARLGRPQPLGGRPRARVGLAAPGARGRGELRPRERGPHPPRREDPALARGQGPRGAASSRPAVLSDARSATARWRHEAGPSRSESDRPRRGSRRQRRPRAPFYVRGRVSWPRAGRLAGEDRTRSSPRRCDRAAAGATLRGASPHADEELLARRALGSIRRRCPGGESLDTHA